MLRFAVFVVLVLALTGTGLLWFLYRLTQEHAEEQASFHAEYVASTVVPDNLLPGDFTQPPSAERLRALDRFFASDVLVGGAVRVKLYGLDGTVRYSNDHSLIGTKNTEEELGEALAGETATDVSLLNHEGGVGGEQKVLETYSPVRLGAGGVIGVLEVYQDYSPVAAAARQTFMPTAIALGCALLLLYVTILPLLRRVAKRLRQQVAELEHQAHYDAVAGLPNRVLFRERLAQTIAGSGEHPECAVLLLDLDRFKEINDTLGHQSGDLVLEEVGRRLRATVRASDLVARLGGDEFAVLASAKEADDAVALAHRLLDVLTTPLQVDGLLVQVEATAGIALLGRHGLDVDTLVRRADIAMYLAKQLHTGVEVYDPSRDQYSTERLQLVGELRGAIGNGDLVVYYQPQARLDTGEVHGVEALVRWQHPERGLLEPAEFVPLAEHTGLIRPLTRYVLDVALRQCRAWHDEGFALTVAVNMTGRDLLDLALPDEVEELLQRCGVAPKMLQLEITENTILTDPVRARAVLSRLSDLGVRLAIDDFGSGHSSLGYLKRLPVDVLKIDKSFVLNMDANEDDAVIVRTTIELGHNLGLEVIAEGVETRSAWLDLERMGCDTAQGFFLGRPVTSAALGEMLRGRAPRAA